jgi:dynein heavy chain
VGKTTEGRCKAEFAGELRIVLELDRQRQEATTTLQEERQSWLQAQEEEEESVLKMRALRLEHGLAPEHAATAYQGEIKRLRDTIVSGEAQCTQLAERATQIKLDAEAHLRQVIPRVEDAYHALEVIDPFTMKEIRSFAKPPALVLHVLKAVCILLGCGPGPSPTGYPEPEEYFLVARKKLLNDCRFLQWLLDFDKDHIHHEKIRGVQAFVSSEEFAPEQLRRCSIAAAALCTWVRAMHFYHLAAQQLMPKRIAWESAEERLGLAQMVLQGRLAHLRSLEQEVEEWQQLQSWQHHA